MSEAIYYIAMVLFLLSAIGYGVFLVLTIKNKLRLDLKQLFLKNTLVLQGFSLGIAVSLVLFTLAFYIDPVTLDLISTNGLVLDAQHQFLSYFFVILFALFGMSFLTAFFYYFYLDNLD